MFFMILFSSLGLHCSSLGLPVYTTAPIKRMRREGLDDLRRALRSATLSQCSSLLDRISIDPNVCFGRPCIKGTRIWVSLILDFLASGETPEQILAAYPQLTAEDIRSAIAYGAEVARERIIPVPFAASE
jgi:uncharacterized protein (DUF433 family)